MEYLPGQFPKPLYAEAFVYSAFALGAFSVELLYCLYLQRGQFASQKSEEEPDS